MIEERNVIDVGTSASINQLTILLQHRILQKHYNHLFYREIIKIETQNRPSRYREYQSSIFIRSLNYGISYVTQNLIVIENY